MTQQFFGRPLSRIQRAFVLGLQDARDLMFTESQRIVNVDRGTLKKSGYTRNLRDGASFGYRAPYAKRVNFGLPRGYSERVKRHTVREHVVRAHRARYGRRTVTVKRHIVRKHFRGPFTRRYPNGQEGSHFMERSIDKYKPQLGKIILNRLRRELS